VGSLSGGEKARLVLAMLVWQRPNLLLLDEPTNHLDLQTREALSMALNEFEGTVMLVSHDRALLREVCDEFWLVAGGTLQPFDGDLDDYQRWLAEEHRARSAQRLSKEAPSHTPVAASGGPQAPSHRREDRKAAAAARQEMAQRTRPLKQELQRIEDRLAAIAEQRAALEARVLQGSAAGGLSAAERAETGRTLHGLQEEEAALEHRWLELGQTLQELQAQDATP